MKKELSSTYYELENAANFSINDVDALSMVKKGTPSNWLTNAFKILAKIALFASRELMTQDGKNINVPSRWNLFKWFKIAKFFFVVISDVVRAKKGKRINIEFGFSDNDLNIKNLKNN